MENDEMKAGTIDWFAGISVSFPKTSGTVPFSDTFGVYNFRVSMLGKLFLKLGACRWGVVTRLGPVHKAYTMRGEVGP